MTYLIQIVLPLGSYFWHPTVSTIKLDARVWLYVLGRFRLPTLIPRYTKWRRDIPRCYRGRYQNTHQNI